MFFGIDLGTTNTLISNYNPLMKKKYMLIPISYPDDQQDRPRLEYSLTSVAYRKYDKDSGKISWLVGRPALEMMETLPDGRENINFYENTKAGIPNQVLYSNSIHPEEVIEEILYVCFYSIKQYLMRVMGVIESDALQHIINSYIGISTPLSMNPNYNKSIRDAGMRALNRMGIDRFKNRQLFTYEEPQAALQNFLVHAVDSKSGIDFIKNLCSEDRTHVAMVIDLGGGTSDIAIRPFRKRVITGKTDSIIFEFPNDCIGKLHNNRIMAKNNAKFAFGGMDFDDRITAYIVYLLNQEYIKLSGIPFLKEKMSFTGSIDFISSITDSQKNRIKGRARKTAIRMKQYFSDETRMIYQEPPQVGLLSENDPVRPQISVSREEYKREVLDPLIEKKEVYRVGGFIKTLTIEELIRRTYTDAGISDLADIDFIYLTGGMSNVVEIRQWLEQHVNGKTKIIWAQDVPAQIDGMQNCLLDICLGIGRAASFANTFDVQTYNNQRIANDIMLDVSDTMRILVPNGTSCPCEGDSSYKYIVDNVIGIPIRLFWGRGEYDSDLTMLGIYKLEKNSVIPKKTELKFHYYLDENKQLTLTANFYDLNNKKKEIQLTNIKLQ